MAEPEELIIEGAHVATRLARAAWRRYGPAPSASDLRLALVRPRLELFATALFRMPVVIAAMEPPPPVTWLARLAGARPDRADHARFMSGTDGRRVLLPPSLPLDICGLDPMTMYRLLAVEQTARLARGTAPVAAAIEDDASRDWFLLAEAELVDRWIAAEIPGLSRALSAVRAAAAERLGPRTERENRYDAFAWRVRALLDAHPLSSVLAIEGDASAGHALAWARAMAAHASSRTNGRRFEHPWYWGRMVPPGSAPRVGERPTDQRRETTSLSPRRVAEMRRRPRVREAREDEDDQTAGTWVVRADEPQESVEDPCGLQRPTDRDDQADPEGLADSLSDLPEARVVRTPDRAREVLRGDDLPRAENADTPAARIPGGISYPEWDYRTGRYRLPGAIVREPEAPLGDAAWVGAALARHHRLTRRVRGRFERLRPRHVRFGRQQDGSELDIDAFVTAAGDMRAGTPVDGRLYLARRRARRELAVALLVDVSASTDGWVSAGQRVVDVEKEALLVVCEALDALGDRYGIFAFSGEGADDVCVLPVKPFDEPTSAAVRRRIAALDADRYTRIGAAVRHLTASLCRERTQRRWLLILSDGKPNDVDLYEGRYGVEDTRQAIAEARRQGVAVFCLTVDREAPRYAARVFGRAGFAVLRRPEQLPAVLIEALRQLLRS